MRPPPSERAVVDGRRSTGIAHWHTYVVLLQAERLYVPFSPSQLQHCPLMLCRLNLMQARLHLSAEVSGIAFKPYAGAIPTR